MIKQDLIERSPVRFFEQTTDGGLQAGEVGILSSKKGLGKTAILVQIALDMLLQEKQVVHVSFTQNASHVITWYEDIFDEMSKKKNLADSDDVKNDLIRKRVILNLHQDSSSMSHIATTLKALSTGSINPSCLIIDGIDFSLVTAEDLKVLKSYAKGANLAIWTSCNSEDANALAGINADVASEIEVAVHLEQKSDGMDLRVMKARGAGEHDTKLKLDTKTLLMAEK